MMRLINVLMAFSMYSISSTNGGNILMWMDYGSRSHMVIFINIIILTVVITYKTTVVFSHVDVKHIPKKFGNQFLKP